MTTQSPSIDDVAKDCAGNWQSFESFGWHDQPDDCDNWYIGYTHNRDSGLLDQSNAAQIAAALEPFTEADDNDPDVIDEHHGHWACGWIDGWAIRVFRDGKITAAFRTWVELQDRLSEYPILDEEDYSRREYDATFENLTDAAWRLKNEYDLPDDWESDVFSWFWDNDQGAVENTDDQGGYPSEEQLRAAFESLEYQAAE